MHFFVSIRYDVVELFSHQFSFIHPYQPAEPTADSVDHQPEVGLILLTNELLSLSLSLACEVLGLIFDIALKAIFDNSSDSKGF
jgi:hypothetical protein